MSYHVGLDHGIASLLGLAPRTARVTCDDCGRSVSCYRNDGRPAAWTRGDIVKPPRWKTTVTDGVRMDLCDRCKQTSPRRSP